MHVRLVCFRILSSLIYVKLVWITDWSFEFAFVFRTSVMFVTDNIRMYETLLNAALIAENLVVKLHAENQFNQPLTIHIFW